jgi:ankyrin repeat protein
VSSSNPIVPLNLEQQHKRAKDLLRAAREADAGALARIRRVRADAETPSRPLLLADAQLAVAREQEFDSWPALVTAIEDRDVGAFRHAVNGADRARVEQLLRMPHVRARVNDPMFAFGQRAAHIAARSEPLLAALLDAGADLGLTSDWGNGPFTVLDRSDERTARYLLSRGATLTPNVAARLGWLDELRALVTADAGAVHARGGDGQQPLHEAQNVAVADFLLDSGADIDARCIDHRSTPAQYALVDRRDVCRRLLQRGATPDIFMAACLGDVALAARVMDADPDCVAARVNEPGYAPVPPLHIYCWTLGFGMSPLDVASKFGRRDVLELLAARSPAAVRLVHAVERADEGEVRALLQAQPSLVSTLPRHAHGHLAFAIFFERFAAAALMLELGFDPSAPGMDGGSALHAACWMGHVVLVERMLARGGVSLDAGDPTHGSPPIGWAAFGSVQRRARGGDYVGVIDRLVAAGADVSAAGNRSGRSLVQMAEGNPSVQAALRRHGASGT